MKTVEIVEAVAAKQNKKLQNETNARLLLESQKKSGIRRLEVDLNFGFDFNYTVKHQDILRRINKTLKKFL
jgi:hypothetical protein